MNKRIYYYIKPLISFLLALIILIIASPAMLIISLLIKITSRGPVFFRQDRLGQHGKVFKMIKFRTMVPNAESLGAGEYCLKNDPRITKFGKFLRKTSLDELPQLFNILFFQMSFVGPRPTLTYHPYVFEKYTSEQKKRFLVKPGITGLAQVKGRKLNSWDDRIKIDITYVENFSMLQDLKILFLTIFAVLKNVDNDNIVKTINFGGLEYLYYIDDIHVVHEIDELKIGYMFFDLETLGKEERQPQNSRKSLHTFNEISTVRKEVKNNKLLVRINPVNVNTKNEIEECINNNVDAIMLPYFKTIDEVTTFISLVNKRAETFLLIETKESVEILDDILKIKGVNKIHIGLNDLSISYKAGFMFNLISNGTVESICRKIKKTGIPYGFGGLSYIGSGDVPALNILIEHFRLESSMAILSRGFTGDIPKNQTYFANFKSKFDILKETETKIVKTMNLADFEKNKFDLYNKIIKISDKYENIGNKTI